MLVNQNKIKYIIILLCFFQAGLLFLIVSSRSNEALELKRKEYSTDNSHLPRHYSYFSSLDFFEESFEKVSDDHFASDAHVYGGIIPHHLVARDYLASFFLGLEKQDYETVILIGPNHFEKGSANIISSNAVWETPYGSIEPDIRLIESLEILQIVEEPFIEEHAISGLVSFIKRSLPDAKIVPIILSSLTGESEVKALAENIAAKTDKEKTLVLSSVDFSHYLPAQVADFHDIASRGVIENFDFDRMDNIEIDSPASIKALAHYLNIIDARASQHLASTNSGRLIGDMDSPGTSHNFYYFSKGSVVNKKSISMLFFGDLMIDRYIKEKIDAYSIDHLFENLKAEENRFFRGVDFIGANLEGAVTDSGEHYKPIKSYDFAFLPEHVADLKKYNFNFFNLANNHFADQGERGIIETRENLDGMGVFYFGCRDRVVDACSSGIMESGKTKVGMAGFSMVYGLFDLEKAKLEIEKLSVDADLVVVNIHWGVEYEHFFNQTQADVAHALIDAGADIIIGHHPHVVQGIEIYKGKPIMYSLGNFIFDQYFSHDTQVGLAVGVNFTEEELLLNLFPLVSKKNQVSLMDGVDKERELANIVEWSDLEIGYASEILSGLIKL